MLPGTPYEPVEPSFGETALDGFLHAGPVQALVHLALLAFAVYFATRLIQSYLHRAAFLQVLPWMLLLPFPP